MANADTTPIGSDVKDAVSQTISRALAGDAHGGTHTTGLDGVEIEIAYDSDSGSETPDPSLHVAVIVDNITGHTADNYLGAPKQLMDVSSDMDALAADLGGIVRTHTPVERESEFRKANAHTGDVETVVYSDVFSIRE